LIKKCNILVTGGSGFIGSNLVDLLILEGHSVLVIDDLSTGLKANHNPRVSYIEKDLCRYIDHPEELMTILNEFAIDTVYHLAASVDVFLSMNKPETIYKINVLSSIVLAEACAKTKVKKIVFASTAAVYGEPKYLPVDEKHPVNPISPYGLSKLAFEQYLKFFSINSNISITVFRLPNVYGSRQRSDLEGGVVAIFYELIKKNSTVTIFGDGEQTRDWVHVEDIINAFVKALNDTSKFEILLLGSNNETSLNKLFDCLAEEIQYDGKPNYTQKRSGDIKNMVMDFEKASNLINWKPTISLRKGISNLTKGI
jgi:UDP-glucose 4-epimerase